MPLPNYFVSQGTTGGIYSMSCIVRGYVQHQQALQGKVTQNRQQKPLHECATQIIDLFLLLTTTRTLPPSPSKQKPKKGPSPDMQNHKIL